MRLLLLVLAFLAFKPAFSQEKEALKQFAIHLTLTERYLDTLNWDNRINQLMLDYNLLLKKLEAEGKIILAGGVALPPRAPERYDIIVLRPMTINDARDLLRQLPVVSSGMMRARLYPFELKTSLPLPELPGE